MKQKFLILGAASVLLLAACNSSDQSTVTTTTDSSSTPGTTSTSTTTTTKTVHEYTSLKTGKSIKVRRDTATGYFVDDVSGQQVDYYYDPIAHDTFDYRGRIVNNALINDNGNWKVEEDRVKLANEQANQMAADTATIHTEVKDAKLAPGTKIKQTENTYKEKTPDSKVKISDDKMKIKTK